MHGRRGRTSQVIERLSASCAACRQTAQLSNSSDSGATTKLGRRRSASQSLAVAALASRATVIEAAEKARSAIRCQEVVGWVNFLQEILSGEERFPATTKVRSSTGLPGNVKN